MVKGRRLGLQGGSRGAKAAVAVLAGFSGEIDRKCSVVQAKEHSPGMVGLVSSSHDGMDPRNAQKEEGKKKRHRFDFIIGYSFGSFFN